jgi:Type II secretory pathway, component ExeA (predicted ATPase)
MFETHFGFENTPFTRSVPCANLYRNDDFKELTNRLTHTARNQSFCVVIGDSGAGKTTLLRNFRDELSHSQYRTLYIADSRLTPRAFYRSLLEQLGFQAKGFVNDAKRQLHREIAIMKGVDGVRVVTIVDEAHLMSMEMLEEIRFLLNVKMDSESPTALILSGQSELWDKKLKLQSYAAIRQRIDFQCVLGHLDRSRTAEYIQAHLTFAGADRDIFTDSAIDAVFKFSSGLPRIINRACSSSLIYAAQQRKQLVDDHMVKLVIETELSGGVAE